VALGEVTIEVAAPIIWRDATLARRADSAFEELIDLCGVDYSTYGNGPGGASASRRGHLLSVSHNWRCAFAALPKTTIFPVSIRGSSGIQRNWFEREAFDLFGIVFPGHPTCAAS
jgi:NADH-quinone oxidoreductase subunit C